jgi:hypothetical protein
MSHQQELRHREQRQQPDDLPPDYSGEDNTSIVGRDEKSPGIRRIEAINKAWNFKDKIWFFIALCVLTCKY